MLVSTSRGFVRIQLVRTIQLKIYLSALHTISTVYISSIILVVSTIIIIITELWHVHRMFVGT